MKARPRRKTHPLRRPGLLAALLLLALLLYDSNCRLQVEEFTLPLDGLPEEFTGFRVVQLSDLHGAQFGKDNEDLLQAVRQQAPDAIVITGDLVDEYCPTDAALPLIRGLVALAPVYYVTGNHEWVAGRAPEIVALLEQAGVICLQNEFVPLEREGQRILIAGIDDPNGYADQKKPPAAGPRASTAVSGGFLDPFSPPECGL